MFKHYAANYVFDGEKFIKNACLSFNKDGFLQNIGNEGSGLIEHERMIFYNGILCPFFSPASLNINEDLRTFLAKQNLSFTIKPQLPIILLIGIDLQKMEFTPETVATVLK